MSTWRDFNDPEVDQYFQQARQGFVGVDPQSQTMARSTSNPRLAAEGQRQLAQQDQANQQRVAQAAQDQARQAAETQRDNLRQQDAQSRMMAQVTAQKAKQAEAERLRQVRMMKAQGVKGATDPITGHQSVATNPDGSPEYKTGKLPGTVGVQTPESANMDLTKAIVGAPTGDITGVTGAENVQPGHVYRNPYGETKAVVDKTQTDPKTGQIYTEEKDSFGAPVRVVTGHDPRWQEKNDLKQDQLRADFGRNQIIQAINNHATAWTPAAKAFKEAKKNLEAFKEDEWKMNPDLGILERQNLLTGKTERMNDPEAKVARDKALAKAKQDYAIAKKAYDPELAKHDALVKAHNAAYAQQLSLRARRIKLELNLPEDDAGTAEILAGAEMGQESGIDPVVHGYINGTDDEESDGEGAQLPKSDGKVSNDTLPQSPQPNTADGTKPKQDGKPVPESQESSDSGTNPPAQAEPPVPKSLAAMNDQDKVAAISQSIGGLKNPEKIKINTSESGISEVTRGPAGDDQIGFLTHDGKGNPFFHLVNSKAGMEIARNVVPSTDGIPLYLQRAPGVDSQGPLKDAEFVASVFDALGQSKNKDDSEALNQEIIKLGASPEQVAEKVRKGELSIQSGEALVKGLYGLSLKPEDPGDPKVFHKWFVEQPAEVQKAWKNAATIEDSEAIKADFVKQWAKDNAWKPTVDQGFLDREWKRMMPGRPAEGQLETAGRGLVMNTIPAIGTVIGAAIGGLLGIPSGPGEFAAVTAGGMAGATAAASLQKRVFSAVFGPGAMKEMELQQAANAKKNPGSEMLGTMAPLLISCLGNPVGGSVKVEGKLLGKALTESGKAAIAAGKAAPKLEAVAQNFATGVRVGGAEKLTDWVNDKKNPDGSPINVLSVMNSMARGGVTFGSLGFAPEAVSMLPIAKNILVKAGVRGTSDAALMTLSGVMYDSITKGELPDWKKAADEFKGSITPFVLQNLVMGALHRSVTGMPEPGKPGEKPPPDATGEAPAPKPIIPTDGTGGKAAEPPPVEGESPTPPTDQPPIPEPPKETGKQIVGRKMIVRSLMKQGVSEEHANEFANRWNGDLSKYDNVEGFTQAARDAFKEIGGVFPNEVETKPEDFTSWKNQRDGITDEQARTNAENTRLQNERLKNEAHDQNAKALGEFKKPTPNEPNNQTTPTEPPAVAEVPVSDVPVGETPPASVEPVEGSAAPVGDSEAKAEAPVTKPEMKQAQSRKEIIEAKKQTARDIMAKNDADRMAKDAKDRNKFPGRDYSVSPNSIAIQPRGLDTEPLSDKVFTYPYDGTAEDAAKVGAKAFKELNERFPEMSQRESVFIGSGEDGMTRHRMEMDFVHDKVKVTTIGKEQGKVSAPETPAADETPKETKAETNPAESQTGNPELDAHIETITKGKSKAAREVRNRLSKADYESDALSDHKETKAEYLRRIICG